ncbi:MAG: DUF5655 domain-containing protein [bacterium]|nr:DUF5655 domain-containing protein [bacterium]
MAKDSQALEQEFIVTVAEKTGHTLDEWMGIIRETGLDKSKPIHSYLKDNHKLNHLQATFLMGIYLNDGKPVYDYEVMFANLFAGKEALLPIYEAVKTQVITKFPSVEFIPTKAYISIEDKKIFACATMTPKLIRVGLDLGDVPFGEYAQKAKSLGAMPNLTHMIEVAGVADVNDSFIGYVEKAYRRNHA